MYYNLASWIFLCCLLISVLVTCIVLLLPRLTVENYKKKRVFGQVKHNQMGPVHFERFVSCEDTLPKLGLFGGSNLNLFNAACTVTGVVLMGLPYRTAILANKKSDLKKHRPEVVAYLLALTYLFYANLHQHAFGSILWDLDIGGAWHSIFFSLMVYEHCKYDLHQQLKLPVLKTAFTRTVATGAALVELVIPFVFVGSNKQFTKGRELASTIGNVGALSVVPFLGYLSWMQRHLDHSRSFCLWLLACVAVKGAEVLVQVEESIICLHTTKAWWIPRFFHAIVIHSEIWAVTECAFSVMHHCKISAPANSTKLPAQVRAKKMQH